MIFNPPSALSPCAVSDARHTQKQRGPAFSVNHFKNQRQLPLNHLAVSAVNSAVAGFRQSDHIGFFFFLISSGCTTGWLGAAVAVNDAISVFFFFFTFLFLMFFSPITTSPLFKR